METIVWIYIDCYEWDIPISIEYTAHKGYPATRDLPGEEEHVSNITFDRDHISFIIVDTIEELEIEQGKRLDLQYSMKEVLDAIQDSLDNNKLLHNEILFMEAINER